MAKNRGVQGETSKSPGKYPRGAINQHKMLATGESLRTCNKADKGGDMKKSGAVSNKRFSSSGSTGGPMNKKPTANRTVPSGSTSRPTTKW